MFLTTNRASSIDPAIKSRIHLSIPYASLSPKSRSGLWETFILKGTKEQYPRWLTTKFLNQISKEDINGREIKNICRVASAPAGNNKRLMQADDIQQGLQFWKRSQSNLDDIVVEKRADHDHETTFSKKRRLRQR